MVQRLTLLVVASAIALAGCAVSTRQEVEMGADYAQKISRELPLIQDAELTRYINVLGDSIARIADDKKADDVLVIAVGDVLSITEYFVLASASNRRLVTTVADEVTARIRETYGRSPLRTEGVAEQLWVLVDYGDVVVHVFHRARSDSLPWLPIVHTPEEDSAFFAGLIAIGATVVAEVDGRLVGFICTEPGWVTQLFVDPDHEGIGTGTALLATTADWPSVQLWTFADNRRARDF